jgi:hypothetical protein
LVIVILPLADLLIGTARDQADFGLAKRSMPRPVSRKDRRCYADGVDFAIARLESVRAQDAMARFGINELLGSDHLFHGVEEAFQALGKQGPNKDKVLSDGP